MQPSVFTGFPVPPIVTYLPHFCKRKSKKVPEFLEAGHFPEKLLTFTPKSDIMEATETEVHTVNRFRILTALLSASLLASGALMSCHAKTEKPMTSVTLPGGLAEIAPGCFRIAAR